MATVKLRAPLKDLAGGNREVAIDGASVGEILRELERQHPKIEGWVLDEHGRVRRHVNVFVDGERVREDAAVASDATVHVLPSISGGIEMTELLVGTKKGLFVLRGRRRRGEAVRGGRARLPRQRRGVRDPRPSDSGATSRP